MTYNLVVTVNLADYSVRCGNQREVIKAMEVLMFRLVWATSAVVVIGKGERK